MSVVEKYKTNAICRFFHFLIFSTRFRRAHKKTGKLEEPDFENLKRLEN